MATKQKDSLVKEVQAQTKFVRISPIKLRRIGNLISKKPAREAVGLLLNLPHQGARIVEKTLKSAIANAVHNHGCAESALVVSRVLVTDAPRAKRYKAQARGRLYLIIKRSSHIVVALREGRGA